MKREAVRALKIFALLEFLVLAVVGVAGFVFDFRTARRWSDTMFVVGAILAALGAMSAVGSVGPRGLDRAFFTLARTTAPEGIEKSTRREIESMRAGSSFAVVSCVVGFATIGAAWLVGKL